tara:strand:+ start:321 stop:845 length:525 start_codon:yes stop_codon:yes gene_type:complete
MIVENTSFVAMSHSVLNHAARRYAIEYFEDNKSYIEKNHNVMKTWQCYAKDDDLISEMVNSVKVVGERVTNRKYKISSSKFVDYVQGSYCKGHRDSVDQSNLSIITMIDMSSDLIGGEAYFSRDSTSSYDQKFKMVPGPLYSGDSLLYGYNLFHGVDEIIRGRRLVLITWLLEI